jgi:UDPglucose 6-dehydrogenase
MLTLQAAIDSNVMTMDRVVSSIKERLENNLFGQKIAIWGLSFKANTDDTRESPAVKIAEMLIREGALVSAFDPIARISGLNGLTQTESALDACVDAVALIVLTEWTQFGSVEPKEAFLKMAPNAIVLDTRGVLDQSSWSNHFDNFRGVSSK